MKRIVLLAVALLAIIIPRLLYHQYTSLYYYYPDTFQYLNRALEMKEGKSAISPFRLPLYPYLLIQGITSSLPIPVNATTINAINFQPILLLQKTMGLVGSLAFLFISICLWGITGTMLVAALLYGINILIIGYEINILTESLSTVLLLITMLFTLLYLDHLKLKFLVASLCTALLLFLLRPVYFLYPLTILPINALFLVSKNHKKRLLLSSLLMCVFFILPFYWAYKNKTLYDYFGITTVSGHNLFAKVIQYDLDTTGIGNASEHEKILKDCISSHRDDVSIVIDDCVSRLELTSNLYDTVSSPILGSFAQKVILKQPHRYIIKSLGLFPQALTKYYPIPYEWISPWSSQPKLYTFWQFANKFFRLFEKFMLAYFVFYPYCLKTFIRERNKKNAFLAIMGTSIFYILFFNTFFVQSEYDRLRAPIEPLLFLFCFYYYSRIFHGIISILQRKNRHLSIPS